MLDLFSIPKVFQIYDIVYSGHWYRYYIRMIMTLIRMIALITSIDHHSRHGKNKIRTDVTSAILNRYKSCGCRNASQTPSKSPPSISESLSPFPALIPTLHPPPSPLPIGVLPHIPAPAPTLSPSHLRVPPSP